MKNNIIFIFLIIFNFIINDGTCNIKLLNSYGLEGSETPHNDIFYTCPFSKNTCCSFKDQMTIYRKWKLGNEEEFLKNKIELKINIYNDLFNLLSTIQISAEKLEYELGKVNTTSNCEVLARRVSKFKIKQVKRNLIRAFKRSGKFFLKSQKGFYCALCDYSNHSQFDLKNKKINVNYRFCRYLIINSLTPALFVHSHFKKYFELVQTYISRCNKHGIFYQKDYPKIIKFDFFSELEETLKNCNYNKNSKEWFLYCGGLCAKYEPTIYNEFFDGDLKKYVVFMDFLDKYIIKYNIIHPNKLKVWIPNHNNNRILDTKIVKNKSKLNIEKKRSLIDWIKVKNVDKEKEKLPKEFSKYRRKYLFDPIILTDSREIIQTGIHPKYDISLFEIVFNRYGINFYKAGQNSLINKTMLIKLKEMDKDTEFTSRWISKKKSYNRENNFMSSSSRYLLGKGKNAEIIKIFILTILIFY